MSVINQVLLDLERRRASVAERSGVPAHVRALPYSGRRVRWEWLAAGGSAALAALVIWIQRPGPDAPPASAPAPLTGTAIVIEKVVSASAGVAIDANRDHPAEPVQPFRLSMELSNPPAEPPPLTSSRLISRMDAEPPAATTTGEQPRTAVPDKSAAVITKTAPVAAGKAEIHKQVRPPTPQEQAENEYRKAIGLLQQGQRAEAQQGFEAALRLQPEHHAARQVLVGLLLESRKFGDAERVLQEGLALAPAQSGFTIMLARLEVDRGETTQAVGTLKKGLEYGRGNADYHAFLAALLQRQGQHEEAIEQFQAALRLQPALGVWWLGLGMSLQAVNRTADAQEAYRRARGAPDLNPELAALAEQRLKQLQ